METTGWHWPIDVLLRQDDLKLSELLAVKAEFEKIRRWLDKQKDNDQEDVDV